MNLKRFVSLLGMSENKAKTDKSEILKRLGIGFHVLGSLLSIIVIIVVIVLATPLLLIWIPIYLIGGWGLRWILTGKTSNIIPFYEEQKTIILKIPKFIKERGITGIFIHFLGSIVGAFFSSFIWLFRKKK